MFNRRFLRIKVFQELYAYWQDEQGNRTLHEKNLLKSLDKAYDLYIFLLALPAEFKFYLGKDLEIQQAKYFPSEKIITPLKALCNNKAITLLENCEFLTQEMKARKLKWQHTGDVFKNMWTVLKQNEFFAKYGEKETHTFAEDKKALSEIFQIMISESDVLDHYLEELFINWEDDQTLAVLTVLKSVDQMKENSIAEFVTKMESQNKEDITFMKDLFRLTIEHDEELTDLIARKTQNWETDRIAMSDMLMMKMALCEILKFPYVPVKVSINEYLELAKLYSTPNSHGFINGILDKIQISLKKENKIVKQGRGLVE